MQQCKMSLAEKLDSIFGVSMLKISENGQNFRKNNWFNNNFLFQCTATLFLSYVQSFLKKKSASVLEEFGDCSVLYL